MRQNTVTSLAVFLSIVVNVNCFLNIQDSFLIPAEAKVEETDYDLLCNDLNITISFSRLSLNTIHENFLSSPLITCLDLSNNGINIVSDNAFYNLPNLKYLNLADNSFNLNSIFKSSFPNLEILILNNNDYLRNFYDRSLPITGTYPKLRKLYLKNSSIDIILATESNFPILSHLHLAGNPITFDDFGWLPETLEYLDLTDNNLERLTLKNLKHLKSLFFQCTNCRKLNFLELENLHNLSYLSLPSNNIREITARTFVNVTSLKYLDLSDNDINTIYVNAFQGMQKLEFLNISINNIEALHFGTLDSLKNLKTLILEKNLLSSIPMFFEGSHLESLILSCNNIKNIRKKELISLGNLQSLNLQDNEITQIDPEAFVGLEKLKLLVLSNNKLSALPSNWLLPMISLEELDLTGNKFVQFGHLGLSETSPMKSLYLSHQLNMIEPQSVYTIPENVTIYLNNTFPYFEICKQKNDPQLTYYG